MEEDEVHSQIPSKGARNEGCFERFNRAAGGVRLRYDGRRRVRRETRGNVDRGSGGHAGEAVWQIQRQRLRLLRADNEGRPGIVHHVKSRSELEPNHEIWFQGRHTGFFDVLFFN